MLATKPQRAMKVKTCHLLLAHVVPRANADGADSKVNRQVIAVSGSVTIHRTDDALPGPDEQPHGTVNVVCPSGDRFTPGGYYNGWAENYRWDIFHCFNYQSFAECFSIGVGVGA